jgi:hypothetical protein
MSEKIPVKSSDTLINDIVREIIPSLILLKASHKKAILAKINSLKHSP